VRVNQRARSKDWGQTLSAIKNVPVTSFEINQISYKFQPNDQRSTLSVDRGKMTATSQLSAANGICGTSY
jgi:hypothetical protein